MPDTPLPQAPDEATLVLARALAVEAGATLSREAALSIFRRHLALVQQHVRDDFETYSLAGVAAAQRLAALTDGIVRVLFEHALRQAGGPLPDAIAVAATGGYGRGLLAPFSDIDLLFLAPEAATPATRRAIEYLLYFLWDLGLRVGHATRSVAQCLARAADDHTILTSLLDARLIAGDAGLFATFRAQFEAARAAAGAQGFIAAKQQERGARHRRFGESAFLVEPNVKEGRGGLRDLQTLYWMARAAHGPLTPNELAAGALDLLMPRELRRMRRAWDFLWTVRFHMHYVAGRAEDRLTFDLQPVVGARMGYTRHGQQEGVERFMRHYFLTARDVMRITRVAEASLVPAPAPLGPADADGLVLGEGTIGPARPGDFETEPIRMLRLLRRARDAGLAPSAGARAALIRHERAALALRGNAEAGAIFADLLAGRDTAGTPNGAMWLDLLNESGILARLLPDWARIVGQMQFDTYHIFTVDEHTIEVVRVLNRLERGELADVAPVATGLLEDLQSRRSLYMAALLHDIAKGRGGDHSVLGADLATAICPGFGFSAEETETVSWLVLHHLLLSQTAFRRDIDDPKTILDVAETVQSPERLKLLLILTVGDMRAVSPRVWNGWKATLLREIYARVAEVLAGGLSTTERDARVARARAAADALLTGRGWNEADRAAFAALGNPGYWLSFDPETHARHARIVREAEARAAPLVVETEPLPARAVTEIVIYAADQPGLFGRLAGALAVAGASIVDARIHTLANGMALDTLWVQDAAGGAFDAPHRLAKLSVLIEQSVSGRLDVAAEVAKLEPGLVGRRMRAIHVPPRVVLDNRASDTHTVVEVNGRDRPGLLHDVAAAMGRVGLEIASAHVTTYGVRAVDVFYVREVGGGKVEGEVRLAELRAALLEGLQGG